MTRFCLHYFWKNHHFWYEPKSFLKRALIYFQRWLSSSIYREGFYPLFNTKRERVRKQWLVCLFFMGDMEPVIIIQMLELVGICNSVASTIYFSVYQTINLPVLWENIISSV